MTKTIKLKEIKARQAQYICQQQDIGESCNNCPLHINVDSQQKIIGCYYLLKMILDEKGEKTITL